MRLLSFAATTAVVLSSCMLAHATTVTTTAITTTATPSTTPTTNGLMSPYTGTTTITFDGSTTVPSSFNGGIVVPNGTTTQGNFATPNGDTTNYFAVGGAPNYTGSSTFTPGGAYNYFGLYWGSIDTYNTVSFYSGSTPVGTVTGGMVPPANGSQTAANTNEFVNFFLTGGTYDRVVLSTTSANFELDNVAYGNVAATPELSSLALLGTGLLGVAGVARKRFKV